MRAIVAAAVLTCTGGTCLGQDIPDAQEVAKSGSSDEIAYPIDFYVPFGVQTALDILFRTPGFVLQDGGDVRGFGGAAGNVLVDGQRPTVKTGGITAVLRRIPAKRVERVVLIRGGGLAAEAQGQTLVANVVLLKDGDDDAGNLTATLARQRNGWVAPSLEATYNLDVGRWEASGTVSAEIDREDIRGVYRILGSERQLLERWQEQAPSRSIETALAASATGPAARGTLGLNARLSQDWFRDRIRQEVRATDETLLTRRSLNSDEAYRELEIGADWTGKAWTDWIAKLVLLARPSSDRIEQNGANESGRTQSDLGQREFEGVARTTLSRKAGSGLQPEIGLEFAQNRLRSRLDYAEDVDGVLVDVRLPGSNLTVTERRVEGFVNLAAPLRRALRGEIGVTGEWSRLKVVGDISNAQQLVYLKPSAALVWTLNRRSQIRAGLRRTVDQLDFGDFAASVQSVEDRPISGNARLRPARITRADVRLDHRWATQGALSLEAFYERRAGVLDYVLTLSNGQAIGDAGDGRVWGVTAQATLPVDFLLADARFTVNAAIRRSKLRDPLSGRWRSLSGMAERETTIAFRHDWQRLKSSWGIDLTVPQTIPTFYVDEIERVRTAERLSIYAETSLVKGVRLTLRARALTGADVYRQRDFFDRPGSGAYAGSQTRHRDRGARLVLSAVRAL